MKRIDMDRLQELVRLHRMGTGARKVARLLAMGPNTERTYRRALEQAEILYGLTRTLTASPLHALFTSLLENSSLSTSLESL